MDGWPPRYDGPEPGPAFPPRSWPSRGQLEYARVLIVVLLLALALPWLAVKLATDPGSVLGTMGRAVARKGVA